MKDKDLHKANTLLLKCKDHLISNENYKLMIHDSLDMLVTFPVPQDLEKYYDSKEYQSHNKSKSFFLDALYNGVKKRAFKRKKSLFNKTHPLTILDFGAGTGDFLLYCEAQGYRVSGVEPNQNARNQAKEKGLKLENDLHSYTGKKFDVITLWHVLEHVPNLTDCVDQLKNLLSDNGQLFIAVPNFKSFDASYYKEFWAAYDVPRHLWHFSQKSIHVIFEAYGFNIINTHPMKYDSFYVSLLSEKNKTGMYNFIKAFFIGLISNLKATQTSEYSSLIYELKHTKKGS